MKNAVTNYENTFYFNKQALSGVLSVDGSYNLEYTPINVIGKGFLKQIMSSVPTANLSLSRYLTANDPILDATGERLRLAPSFNAGLYYDDKYFAFEKGYLSSYGLSCAVGEIPTIESQFQIFGDIGPDFNPSGQQYGGSVFVPQVKNILLTTRNSTTNRITNFSIDYSIPKVPIYGVSSANSELPIEVHNAYPIEVTSSFTIEIDDYETKSVFADLTSSSDSEFTIDIKASILQDISLTDSEGNALVDADTDDEFNSYDRGDDPSVFKFTASNAVIVSEQVTSSSDDVMSVNLSYKTYLD